MDWQTMIIISFIGVVVMAIAVPKIVSKMLKRRNVSSVKVIQEQPKEPKERWEVKFAQGWYECQPISADTGMGLGVVLLTDRRTHSRPITRPLSEIIRRV